MRELKNLVHRAYILADEEMAAPHVADQLGSMPIRNGGGAASAAHASMNGDAIAIAVGSTVAAVEQRLIMATLEACGGNKQTHGRDARGQPEDALQPPVRVSRRGKRGDLSNVPAARSTRRPR